MQKKERTKKGALNEIRHPWISLYNKSGKLKMLVQSKKILYGSVPKGSQGERERERARWRHDICSCDKCSGPNFLEVVGLGLAL